MTQPVRAADPPVPWATILTYSAPGAGLGFAFFLASLYLLKFSTDVLLVSPAVMGVLFGLSRLWDAVSDPLAGHLSDRTHSRLGRRRSWLLASTLPLGGGTLMLWMPPAALEGPALVVWVGAGLFLFYTGTTVFGVPHESLGAELSTDHHERTRIFGVKQAVQMVGTLLAVGAMQLLIGSDAPRALASRIVPAAVLATVLLTLVAVSRVRERTEYQGRGGVDLRSAFADVLRNPHARRLLLVFGIETFGTTTLGVLTPFVMEYVLRVPEMTGSFIMLYFVPALLLIPVWVRLSQRVGKRNLWVFALSVLTTAFGGLFFVREGDLVLVGALGLLAGIGGGCGQVMGPSIQADVIDFDEWRTGQRKEGVYFAVWNFVRKASTAASAMLAGVLLSAVGYVPNVEQTETARLGMRLLFGIVPGTCLFFGTLALLRFRLDGRAHAAIRRELDARRDCREGDSSRPGAERSPAG